MARIMIVEDEHNLRTLYQLEIEDMGHEVVPVSNGRQAIDSVHQHNPDLIVLDLQMPEGDGLDFLTWLMSNHLGIPVIIYSAYSHYKNDFMTWGAESYLIKSSDLTELKNEITKTLHCTPIG
jgi:DNA-binding NtrC family response regulator